MTLTKPEQRRLAEIRARVKRFKRSRLNVKSWEATFFLGIIDRLVRKLRMKRAG